MCGIFGSLGVKSKSVNSIFTKVQELLYHRGPDDKGFEFGNNYALGFTRLAILDLSPNGSQPMFDSSKRYCIVFNGEIFNYKELQSNFLDTKQFKGSSDTEVLLHLLLSKGADAIPLLNGMFAFCFIDTLTGNFLLARDRFGIKPLYYTIQNNTLSFASELVALKQLINYSPNINEKSLLEYLGVGYLSGINTIFEDIYRLEPACFLDGNINKQDLGLRKGIYWTLDHFKIMNNYRQALEEFEELFYDAVSIRLRSDVPLGVFLSGGIDSGLVAAFASKKQDITCYNIGFEDKVFDESSEARATAEHLGAELKCINLKKIDIENIRNLATHYDEPFADSSALPSFEVCKAGAKEAKVFLTGDAGDEAFAGYNRYIKRLKYDPIHNLNGISGFLKTIRNYLPKRFSSTVDKISSDSKLRDAYYDNIPISLLSNGLLQSEYHQKFTGLFLERVSNFEQSADITRNQQIFDYNHFLPNDILVKMDRASMSNSIEVRSPFLDYRIHEFAARLPRSWLLDKKIGKKFLRDIAIKYLPPKIQLAKKMGFGIPINQWTREPRFLNDLEVDAKNSDLFKQFLDFDNFNILKQAHQSSKMNAGWILWNIAMLLSWERNNVIGK